MSSCPASTASKRCGVSASRTSPNQLPVILFTGLDAPDALATAGDLGANAWLAKPYQLADLLAAVRGQIASPSVLARTV